VGAAGDQGGLLAERLTTEGTFARSFPVSREAITRKGKTPNPKSTHVQKQTPALGLHFPVPVPEFPRSNSTTERRQQCPDVSSLRTIQPLSAESGALQRGSPFAGSFSHARPTGSTLRFGPPLGRRGPSWIWPFHRLARPPRRWASGLFYHLRGRTSPCGPLTGPGRRSPLGPVAACRSVPRPATARSCGSTAEIQGVGTPPVGEAARGAIGRAGVTDEGISWRSFSRDGLQRMGMGRQKVSHGIPPTDNTNSALLMSNFYQESSDRSTTGLYRFGSAAGAAGKKLRSKQWPRNHTTENGLRGAKSRASKKGVRKRGHGSLSKKMAGDMEAAGQSHPGPGP